MILAQMAKVGREQQRSGEAHKDNGDFGSHDKQKDRWRSLVFERGLPGGRGEGEGEVVR